MAAKKKTPRKPGRPTKLDEKLTKRLLGAVERGKTDEEAARLAGISYSCLKAWKARAEAHLEAVEAGEPTDAADLPFVSFVAAYSKARDYYLDNLERVVEREALLDGRLALDILSRRHPDKWGRRSTVNVADAAGGPVIFTAIVPGSRLG